MTLCVCMMYCIANCPLPTDLQVWLSPEHQELNNHGDSLFDNHPSEYPLDTPGSSLSMDTVNTTIPVEEVNEVSYNKCTGTTQ